MVLLFLSQRKGALRAVGNDIVKLSQVRRMRKWTPVLLRQEHARNCRCGVVDWRFLTINYRCQPVKS